MHRSATAALQRQRQLDKRLPFIGRAEASFSKSTARRLVAGSGRRHLRRHQLFIDSHALALMSDPRRVQPVVVVEDSTHLSCVQAPCTRSNRSPRASLQLAFLGCTRKAPSGTAAWVRTGDETAHPSCTAAAHAHARTSARSRSPLTKLLRSAPQSADPQVPSCCSVKSSSLRKQRQHRPVRKQHAICRIRLSHFRQHKRHKRPLRIVKSNQESVAPSNPAVSASFPRQHNCLRHRHGL